MPEVGQGKTDEVEMEARAQGWVPKGEWHGAPDKYVNAETFVNRGKEIAGLATAKSKQLEEEIEDLKSEIGDLKAGNVQFREYHEKLMNKEAEQRQNLIGQLEVAKAKAITEGDGNRTVTAERQIEILRQQQAAALQQRQASLNGQQQTYANDMQKWVIDNPWYTGDRELRLIADGLADRVRAEMPQAAPGAFLKELAKRVKQEKPDHPAFTNPNRSADSSVNSDVSEPEGSKKRSGKRSWENLPADDRKQAELFIETHGLSKAQYLTHYEWD